MDATVYSVRGYQPYPYGPKDEAALLKALKEPGPDGFITGGPETPDEWLHWNGAHLAGWGGRWPQIMPGTNFCFTPRELMPEGK